HYLDVGQGDSEFIELPNGENILIDAGEAEYGDTVSKYISSLGYSEINYLIGTHPHADHIGGLSTVINNFKIDSIYMPKAVTTTTIYENLLDTIANKGLSINTGKSGVSLIDTDDLSVYMIAPNSSVYDDLNQYSIVLMIRYKNNKFLFMGDAGTVSEGEITSDVSANVIKVGHHGSSTASSASFVKKVSPEYAIIEVGANNTYNLPKDTIIKRWESVGAKVLRTDESGNITIISDGNNIEVK
ncbi:MAG TPA: MBL fold metallo-hydrolase, partial [Bacilli bacterium]|nr:MBL fold metallo-hydrolase [Bacilli bacterium]